ncbi:MAG: ATP-dependent DNA helicase RecG [Nitrospinae bacterium CG11_big_fil_rev_8_21_14_0_20_45_15]|nr:MAG: ATP-dependent DNA helicase RecG [Nitrospinae bacterium CG11_big_fil_rev_8_21_14_0_20_45_15]
MSMKPETAKKNIPSTNDPLQFVKGVGPKRALLLKKLGLETVDDALRFLPFRYEDLSRVKKISELVPGEHVTLAGTIANTGTTSMGIRKKVFEVIVQDETGFTRAKWFQFTEKYMKKKFPVGNFIVLSGKPVINRYAGSGLEFVHPEAESFAEEFPGEESIGQIFPVYHATEGLPIKALRNVMKNIINVYQDRIEEFLPEYLLEKYNFPGRAQALANAHFPPKDTDTVELENFKTAEQQRLIFEELFLIQLGLAFKRNLRKNETFGRAMTTRGPLIRQLIKFLPFELTGAQKRSLGEIMENLEQNFPMNRLLQGDVGSGKTIVALTALLTAVDNGRQGAMMAPTELLSEQHFSSLLPFCQKLGVSIELATATGTAKDRRELREKIANGTAQIVVGTHALIQEGVNFNDLGLIVVDEQHRFGVLQRDAIGKKGNQPHALIMTATPIPRSLSLTLYGDFSVSYLDELPAGRQPIKTQIFYEKTREKAYALLYKEILKGGQAYIVCPLIDESEKSSLKAVVETLAYVKMKFPDVSAELIHGKMKREERQKIMSDFQLGLVQVLVATTVIEVGIDVPNASVIMIEHSERFGLSQLHQLRGRVGRGERASHCLLIAYYPLTEEGKARLNAMKVFSDGFSIAEEDLKIRGPGDFLGARQSGMPFLRMANLLRDFEWIEIARNEAKHIMENNPELNTPDLKKLKQALGHYLGDKLDLINVI